MSNNETSPEQAYAEDGRLKFVVTWTWLRVQVEVLKHDIKIAQIANDLDERESPW